MGGHAGHPMVMVRLGARERARASFLLLLVAFQEVWRKRRKRALRVPQEEGKRRRGGSR